MTTRPRIGAALLLLASACGGASTQDDGGTDAHMDARGAFDADLRDASPPDGAPSPMDAAPPVDGAPAMDGAPTTDGSTRPVLWAINLVVPGGAASIQRYLDGARKDVLYPITRRFYERHGDDFDFLYLVAEVDRGAGRGSPINPLDQPFSAGERAGFNCSPLENPEWASVVRRRDAGRRPTMGTHS